MNIFRDISALPLFHNAVVTIGSFDGVHRGHQRILKRIKRLARQYEGESVVVTFDPHPRQVLSSSDDSLKLLTTTEEKLEYLQECGVNNVVIVPFTIEFSHIGPREYVERFLIDRFKPRCLVVGYNHRFGRNRQGNFHLLQSYAKQGAFDLIKIEKQEIEHIDVSSTKIRNALSVADIRTGNTLLNHPYRITGRVIRGRKVGRSLGYPTANIEPLNPAKLIPAQGVYAAFVNVDQVTFEAMLYIGTRPTFDLKDTGISIEAHVLGFNQEIYGERIDIDIIEFIREDLTLTGAEELRIQIQKDELDIKSSLAHYVQRQHEPSVAMVALNYNGKEMLEKYLATFMAVEYGKLDIIIADNGSQDDSVSFIQSHFPLIQIVRFAENHGYAGGYNLALANLDYDYYALVNTDIALTPQWLSRIITVMEAEPNLVACQPKIRSDRDRESFEYAGACGGFMDALGYAFCAGRILNTIEKDIGQYDYVKDIFWATGAALVVRGEAFHAAGGFDASYFAHQEEIDVCWTFQRAGYRIGVIPESVVYHFGGATLAYDTPAKVFLNFRNNLSTITKHMPAGWLIIVLLMRVFLDFLACLHFIFRAQFLNAMAVIRAYAGFWLRLPQTIRKRLRLYKRIEAMRIGPSKVNFYRRSILIDYYLLNKRYFSQLTQKAHVTTESSQNTL
ncbi:MAG TPA: bifunctional riboflavin kinase/FAD synthetase [Saprospiraceae bacterium]|nr:bifunctional riboflavin kinase/FAD synthetase [Saprospiraceae bacterium]